MHSYVFQLKTNSELSLTILEKRMSQTTDFVPDTECLAWENQSINCMG